MPYRYVYAPLPTSEYLTHINQNASCFSGYPNEDRMNSNMASKSIETNYESLGKEFNALKRDYESLKTTLMKQHLEKERLQVQLKQAERGEFKMRAKISQLRTELSYAESYSTSNYAKYTREKTMKEKMAKAAVAANRQNDIYQDQFKHWNIQMNEQSKQLGENEAIIRETRELLQQRETTILALDQIVTEYSQPPKFDPSVAIEPLTNLGTILNIELPPDYKAKIIDGESILYGDGKLIELDGEKFHSVRSMGQVWKDEKALGKTVFNADTIPCAPMYEGTLIVIDENLVVKHILKPDKPSSSMLRRKEEIKWYPWRFIPTVEKTRRGCIHNTVFRTNPNDWVVNS